MYRIILFLLYVWQLPQNLLGLILYNYLKIKKEIFKTEIDCNRLFVQSSTAVSLGRYIFWNNDSDNEIYILSDANKYHEYGHSRQSAFFGPLYLLIIGLPSSLRALYARYYYEKNKVRWSNYYKGFPENWADKLGHVDSRHGKIL